MASRQADAIAREAQQRRAVAEARVADSRLPSCARPPTCDVLTDTEHFGWSIATMFTANECVLLSAE